jgi:hypothetical protein
VIKAAPPPLPIGRTTPRPKAAKPALTAKAALQAKTAKAAQSAAPVKKADEAQAAPNTGFAADLIAAGWDDAVDAIRGAGAAAVALVERWIAASNAVAIAAVAEAEGIDNSARKAARRAINVLKARGIELPARPRVAQPSEGAARTFEATMLPPDSSGTGSFSIIAREAGSRYHLAEVIVREPIGIVHAGTAWLSGTRLKAGRERAEEAVGVAPTPVPVEWARYRVAKARALNAKSGQILPLSFEGCRELMEPVPATEPPHPLATLEADVTPELAAERTPGSASLHEEPEFRGWLPDRGAINELLQKVGERVGEDGISDAALVDEAMREELSAATDRFFSPEVRDIVASRMRDAAISVQARRGKDRALDALAVARAVREAGLITSPPREIPFLVSYFQKALGWLAHQSGGQLRIPVPTRAATG